MKNRRITEYGAPRPRQIADRLFVVFFLEVGFGNDFLQNVGRHDFVVVELHGVTAHSACHAGQRTRIRRDFTQGNLAVNH